MLGRTLSERPSRQAAISQPAARLRQGCIRLARTCAVTRELAAEMSQRHCTGMSEQSCQKERSQKVGSHQPKPHHRGPVSCRCFWHASMLTMRPLLSFQRGEPLFARFLLKTILSGWVSICLGDQFFGDPRQKDSTPKKKSTFFQWEIKKISNG